MNYVEVFDERVIIRFDSISYQPIIDELNTYLTENEKSHGTIEDKISIHDCLEVKNTQKNFMKQMSNRKKGENSYEK